VGGGVGAGQRNRGRDVQGTKRALAWAGYYPNAKAQRPDARPDDDLDWGLKRFQRDFGLKTDGFLRPGGETERTLDRVAGPLIDASVRPAFAYGSRVQEPPQPTLRPMPRGQADPGVQLYDAADVAKTDDSPVTTAQATPEPREGTPVGTADADDWIPVPDDKADWFAVGRRQEQWKNFQRGARALPDATDAEVEVYVELHAREGGMVENSRGAVGGILPETLDGLADRGWVTGIDAGTTPAELDEAQVASVYRAYFDDVLQTVDRSKPGHQNLSDLGDTQGAYALGEALFRFGRRDGTRYVQEAINEAAPSPIFEPDGQMGPETFAAYRQFLADSATHDMLLNALADRLTVAALKEKNRFDRIRP